MKTCNSCRELKTLDAFGKNKSTKDGLMYQCKSCNNARVSKYNKDFVNGTEKNKKYYTNRRYVRHGMTKEQFDALLESQGGCAICGETQPVMHIDHDHTHCPGQYGCAYCVRGILCSNCNTGLGLFQDDASRMQKAIAYLVP